MYVTPGQKLGWSIKKALPCIAAKLHFFFTQSTLLSVYIKEVNRWIFTVFYVKWTAQKLDMCTTEAGKITIGDIYVRKAILRVCISAKINTKLVVKSTERKK